MYYAKKGTVVLAPVSLFSQLKVCENRPVSIDVGFLKVVKQLFAFPNELQKPLLGRVVFLVFLQVFSKVTDSMGKKRDLRLWRARVFRFL